MTDLYNFSAGPAMLPEAVMKKAQAEFRNWNSTGVSAMECSHRSPEFQALGNAARANFRELLNIPEHYEILFLHGGAQMQFAGIPLNLGRDAPYAAYVQTGTWSKKAAKEATSYLPVRVIASSEDARFTNIPRQETWAACEEAAYLYYTDNETVHGVEFSEVPEVGDVPLIADMSSNLLSRPVPIERFGLIYACSQKNLGMAGVTVVIVRRDLLERQAMERTPSVLNYALEAKADSMLNTPATYSWYMMNLVLEWVKAEGGVDAMAQRALRKSHMLYEIIDASDYYHCPVEPGVRSRMNVVFTLKNADDTAAFLSAAGKAGLKNLKGHRSVGGIRASIYNAMPEDGVRALGEFMQSFEASCG